jgi:hypothetical protein
LALSSEGDLPNGSEVHERVVSESDILTANLNFDFD